MPEERLDPEPDTVEPLEDRMPLGKWLVENMPRGTCIELPDRREPDRPNPFLEETDSRSPCH